MMNVLQTARYKLMWYLRELFFAVRNGTDWKTRYVLVKQTILYHLYNAIREQQFNGRFFSVDMEIARDYRATLKLREQTGDIYALYEIAMDETYHIPSEYVAPGEVEYILDCGGNIGITALYYAASYPNAKIISVEAHPENFKILKENVARENRITPVHAALVGVPRKSVFFTTSLPTLMNRIGDKAGSSVESCEVKAMTVGEICKDLNIPQIDIMKIDIEGGEKDVFSQADFLEKVRFVIAEIHPPYSFEQFNTDLKPYHFRAFQEDPGKGLKMVTARES